MQLAAGRPGLTREAGPRGHSSCWKGCGDPRPGVPGAETTSVCTRSRALRSLPLSSPGLRPLLRLELRGGPGWQPHPRALPHPGRGPGRRAGPQPLPAGERHLGLQGGSPGSRSSMRPGLLPALGLHRSGRPEGQPRGPLPGLRRRPGAGAWGLGGNHGVKHCPGQQASINSPLT